MDKPSSPVKPVLREAWDYYHAAVTRSRERMEASNRFQKHPDHRAQAYYAIAEAEAMVYNMVIAPRLNHPQVYTHTTWLTHFFTLGGNCTDFIYGSMVLDGRQTYRLKGRFGDLKLILMQVHNVLMGQPDSRCIGNHNFCDFEINKDGSFEVILSATKHDGNWIPLDADSDFNFVLIRRVIGDWYEDKGDLDLELLTTLEGYDEFSEEALAKRLRLAADFMRNFLVEVWNIGFYKFCYEKAGWKKNAFGLSRGANMATKIAGSPTSDYALAVYEVQPDEALIIELDPPDAYYWQFQLYDVWTKSLDIMHNQTDINMVHAAIDADGKFRAVLSLSDPGVANWLDPVGRWQGSITFRNYHTRNSPNPSTKLVKLADLDQHLPADTKRVTPEQRRQDMQYRRDGIRKLYSL